MRKISYMYSLLLAFFGVLTLLFTKAFNLVMPKIGLSFFQLSMKGSYGPSDYVVDFEPVNIMAAFMIIAGLSVAGLILFLDYKAGLKE